jgi:hypothetical protein
MRGQRAKEDLVDGLKGTVGWSSLWIALWIALWSALWSASVQAMVVLPAEFSEMVAKSPLIVHGRVIAVRSLLTGDRRAIESLVTLSVTESLKGEPGATVVLRVPGGQVGRYRRVMVGAPEFEEGDEVIVFLGGHGPAVPMPFGLSQGVYRVTRDRNREVVVTPPPVDGSPVDGRVTRGDPARRELPVGEFARRVRDLVAGRVAGTVTSAAGSAVASSVAGGAARRETNRGTGTGAVAAGRGR